MPSSHGRRMSGPLESQDAKRPRIAEDSDGRNRRDTRGAAIREGAQMKDWLSKEDDFVLRQAKKRAAIRVRESRAKPVDFLAVNLRFIDTERDATEENELEEVEVKPKEPKKYLSTLHPQELVELYDDLNDFYKLETCKANRDYWRALMTVCKQQRKLVTRVIDESQSSLQTEIDKILLGKSEDQLAALERTIAQKLDSQAPIDVDYWERLYKAVRVKEAWTRLDRMFLAISRAAEDESERKHIVFRNGKREASEAPVRFKIEEEDDEQKLVKPFVRSTEKDFESAAARLYKSEASHELEEDEELFNKEADVQQKEPKWTKIYPDLVPIKPKYFNRVQTGFEWNSYNKIHYNEESLPPKIVWGYRFNIFYPDLLDTTKAPTYKLERRAPGLSAPNSIQEETCIIRFSAGAPYADVCFEIVDKDWDHSSRYDRGFKSSFDKGILQLHFKFKRISYRK